MAVEETFSGDYVVVFDPLDGSSNIDAGALRRGGVCRAVNGVLGSGQAALRAGC